MQELDILRLNKIKNHRNEMTHLKKTKPLFDINRFTLNEEDQYKYKRNINIARKLLYLLPLKFNNPFHIYINNVKYQRKMYYQYLLFINKLINKYNIPYDIKQYFIKYI